MLLKASAAVVVLHGSEPQLLMQNQMQEREGTAYLHDKNHKAFRMHFFICCTLPRIVSHWVVSHRIGLICSIYLNVYMLCARRTLRSKTHGWA